MEALQSSTGVRGHGSLDAFNRNSGQPPSHHHQKHQKIGDMENGETIAKSTPENYSTSKLVMFKHASHILMEIAFGYFVYRQVQELGRSVAGVRGSNPRVTR